MSEINNPKTANKYGRFFSKALSKLEIPVEERQTLSFLRNPDLLPIRKDRQTWGFWSNFGYWGIMSFSVGTWMSAASVLSYSLFYPETIGNFIIGDVVTIMFTLANCYPGWDWKVGYTLSQRFVFGIYGSVVGILIRVLMSIVSYSHHTWMGGICLNMILNSWSPGDVGDLFTSAKSTATGSEKAWAWVYMISYWFGSLSGINNTKPVNTMFNTNEIELKLE
ncbi:hypothetical protein RI543_004432 [Arxiozyma heterogenica]|uniref:Uncharacterized protein n=1 Tax=Arxiozyma heterogenica TaxID=278026 RepID=A0AAN7WJN0_9SACH|nr:hypothetical protein RI543_004432 [Kazachstania heterogenica]